MRYINSLQRLVRRIFATKVSQSRGLRSHFRVSYTRTQSAAFSLMFSPNSRFTGKSGRTYRLIHPLGHQRAGIWKAVDDADESEQFVIKGPSSDDNRSLSWPLFQHEVEMQTRFSGSAFIRQMVDFVPSTDGAEPKMVLQAFEKTLWTARTQRPMTTNEIKWIMKAVIIGLWTVHREGLVYSGTSYLLWFFSR